MQKSWGLPHEIFTTGFDLDPLPFSFNFCMMILEMFASGGVKMEEERVGVVVKYFARAGAAAVNLEKELSIGDTIHIKGHTTDFEQIVESMQIENKSVDKAKSGDAVGIKVKDRVRSNDIVYRVKEE